MRWGVEHRIDDSGTIGLVFFYAVDQAAADEYIDRMCTEGGHNWIGHLRRIEDGSMEEIRRLFPNYVRPQLLTPVDERLQTKVVTGIEPL